MAYADIQLFMKKLKQLINGNDNPLFNIPEIIHEKPQFQLLYEDLGFMIQTLFIDKHQDPHELEKLNDLKKRFTDAAEEAQYIVDLFLSGVIKWNSEYFPASKEDIKPSLNLDDVRGSFNSVAQYIVDLFLSGVIKWNNQYFPASKEDIKPSLNLDDVRGSFNSVKVELMRMGIDSMKMDSSQRPERKLNQSADDAPPPRNSLGSKKIQDEITVGIDDDVKLIKDKLMEDRKKLDVISIVGMGGIGKTTLAAKVFNDGYVMYHFHVRVWVTVSQTFDKRAVLIQILESISGQSDLGVASDSRLRELVHKKLMDKRYLIVIDDIWHIETWDNLKLFFPRDHNGSRILLTSRLTDVAKHATSNGLVHHLGYLNKERSWELLCQKVFDDSECPERLIKPGMQIAENCQGLPLAVIIIAGVLAKEPLSEKFWVEIADRTASYIVGGENGCMKTLGLSYNHLPLHLRECFLYLCGFPEDYEFKVRWLILLWVAEGFIQEDGNRSLEDIAMGYLMDLIDRNLVVVANRSKYNGDVMSCILHDLVRELCLKKAKEEGFILQTESQTSSSHFSNVTTPPYKPVRMFIREDSNILSSPYLSTENLRSILYFNVYRESMKNVENYCCSFVLLRVLDLRSYSLDNFPEGMEVLVHLRYLAIFKRSSGFPSSICNLWGLQTLIYITRVNDIILPSNISNLVNLRHLLSYHPSSGTERLRMFSYHWVQKFILPSIEKPMNLQTFSYVKLGDGVDLRTFFPYIKELKCHLDEKRDFQSPSYLEKLDLTGFGMEHITLPVTLKTLRLGCCGLPWTKMSIIQSLPNLEVLKLHEDAFVGSCWNTDEHEFRKLTFLSLCWLDVKLWKADSSSFPCLKRLDIDWCIGLEDIPLEIGEIPTLELIKIKKCRPSVGESVRRIQKEQHDFGNYNLKIHIKSEL